MLRYQRRKQPRQTVHYGRKTISDGEELEIRDGVFGKDFAEDGVVLGVDGEGEQVECLLDLHNGPGTSLVDVR